MTALGAVFVALILWGLFQRALFPWVLALSAAFPYSAALNIAGNSVTPFHLTALFAILLLVLEPRIETSADVPRVPKPGATALALFAAWSLFITLVAPIMFRDEPVLNPRIGIDAAVAAQSPLGFTISTVAQAGYLVLTIGAVLYLARQKFPPALALVPFAAGTVIGALNIGFVTVGLPWPTAFFDTSMNVIYSHRLRGGVFNEPSEFGGFAVSATVLFVVAAARSTGLLRVASVALALLAAVNLVSSQSGTALAGLAIVASIGGLALLWRLIARGRGALLVLFGFGAAAIALALYGGTVIGWGMQILTGKIGSTSLDVRSSSDAFSVELFFRTWGMGVGLGANRPSSFATMLLSCVGVVGVLAFVAFLIRILPIAARTPLGGAAVWGLLAFLAAKAVSLPDLTTPGMWILIGVCTQLAWRELDTSQKTTDMPTGTSEIGWNDGPQGHPANSAQAMGCDPGAHDHGWGDRPGRDDADQTPLRSDRTALRRDAGQRLGR